MRSLIAVSKKWRKGETQSTLEEERRKGRALYKVCVSTCVTGINPKVLCAVCSLNLEEENT